MNGKPPGLLYLLPPLLFVAGCATTHSDMGTQPAPAPSRTYVYVQTSSVGYADPSNPPSTLAFSAASDGTLTLLPPPLTAGQQRWIASQGRSIFALDTDVIHLYDVQADGSISGPVASVNTLDYCPNSCSHPNGSAVVDPSGQYLTIEQGHLCQDGDPTSSCDVWQTYRVQGTGFQFLGFDESDYSVHPGTGAASLNLSAVSGNSQFAYGILYSPYATSFTAMKRDSTGTLRQIGPNFSEVDPAPDPAAAPGDDYFPRNIAADSSNRLAVVVDEAFTNDPTLSGTEWLAIYTIDPTTGAIQSTNTYANMPQLDVGYQGAEAIAFSPARDLVVVSGAGKFQIFGVNGADPAMPLGQVAFPDQYVTQVAWDNNNHLYVLVESRATSPAVGQRSLYVYTVTGSGIAQVSGSPWDVPGGYKLVVVPAAD